jgi:hypothetical protein
MKFFTALLLTALLAHAAPLYFPWWSFAVTSFLVALLIYQKAGLAFVSGFFGVFLLFTVHTLVLDYSNEHLLAKKVALILPLGGSSLALILVSAFIGGLVSAFAAMSGSFARGKGK